MAWAGRHFYVRAWKALRHHSADMDTLVAAGTGAAFLYSVVATLAPGVLHRARRRPQSLLRAGDHHHRARAHGQRVRGARQATAPPTALRALVELQPATARVVRGEEEVDVPVST